MLPIIGFAPVHHVPRINAVVDDRADFRDVPDAAEFGSATIGIQLQGDLLGRLDFHIAIENAPDDLRLLRHDDQLAILDPVAEGNSAAHPHAFLPAGRVFVTDAFRSHLPLVLGEGHEDVQHHPPRRGGRVDVLGDAHERHVPLVEAPGQFREVADAPGQPVDLVDQEKRQCDIAEKICEILNESETCYPGTEWKRHYEMMKARHDASS